MNHNKIFLTLKNCLKSTTIHKYYFVSLQYVKFLRAEISVPAGPPMPTKVPGR